MAFPTGRPRRLRRTAALRSMVRETRIEPSDLILPLFAVSGKRVRRPIESMPGVSQLSVDLVVEEVKAAQSAGIRSVILFGIPDDKDAQGTAAWDPNGPVCNAFKAIKDAAPDVVAIADVCLCEYTDHGHCGPLARDARGHVAVANDQTLPLLARARLPGRHRRSESTVEPSGRGVQRERRVRDAQGGRTEGLDRRAPRAARDPHRDQAGRRGPDPHLQRGRRGAIPVGSGLIVPPSRHKVFRWMLSETGGDGGDR